MCCFFDLVVSAHHPSRYSYWHHNLGASIQVARGPRNWETFCATLGSFVGSKATRKDAKCTFIVPSLGVRAQIHSIYDRRNGVGKPVLKLAQLGHDLLCDMTALNFCEPSISDVVLRHIFWQASPPAQDRAVPLRLLAL